MDEARYGSCGVVTIRDPASRGQSSLEYPRARLKAAFEKGLKNGYDQNVGAGQRPAIWWQPC